MNCPNCGTPMEREDHCEPDAMGDGTTLRPHAIYSCDECGYEAIWRPYARPALAALHDPRNEGDIIGVERAMRHLMGA